MRKGLARILIATLSVAFSLPEIVRGASLVVSESAELPPRTALSDGHSRPAGEAEGTHGRRFKDGVLLVKFRSGVGEAQSRNRLHSHGLEKIREFTGLRLHHVRLGKGVAVAEAIRRLTADPAVEYAEPDYELSHQTLPDDPRFPELWGLQNTGQTGGTPGADIDATDAWKREIGSDQVVVAIIDSGIDYTHPDLVPNLWVNPGEIPANGIDDDGNGYVDDVHGIDTVNQDSDPWDDHGHGTHVAGIVGARGDNGIGVTGIAWQVRLMACKFLGTYGTGTVSGALQCLQYIQALKARGIPVVATNNSWNGPDYSRSLADAIFAQREILFVTAAGNSGADNDRVESYPADYALPNVITVAATDRNDRKGSFSSFGRQTVAVGAPGAEILSTLPAQNYWRLAGGYGLLSGTSMASPLVAGLSALLAAQEEGRPWWEIRNLILASGDPLSDLAERTATGRRINAATALNCSNLPYLSLSISPDSFPLQPDTPLTLTAVSISCGHGVGPVVVQSSSGESVTLQDDGLPPDLVAGDGVYSASMIPAQQVDSLTVTSPAGSQRLPFVRIAPYLPAATTRSAYQQSLTASGGQSPLSWSIASGSLPAGLTLDGATGVVSGRPTQMGTAIFTVQVTDGLGRTTSQELTLAVSGSSVPETWAATFNGRNVNTPRGLALDDAGNRYVTGSAISRSSHTHDVLTVKYDPAGNLLWSRVYDSGGSDVGKAVAVDSQGAVLVAGCPAAIDSNANIFLLKYDTNGNLLWIRTFDGGVADLVEGMAVGSDDDIYLTGYKVSLVGETEVLTLKYSSSGELLWSRTARPDELNKGFAIALDLDGNAYVAAERGHRLPDYQYAYELLTLKYSPAGELLWTASEASAGYGGRAIAVERQGTVAVGSGFGDNLLVVYNASGEKLRTARFTHDSTPATFERLAVDADGYLYALGAYQSGSRYDYALAKWDPTGSQLWSSPAGGEYIDRASGLAIDPASHALLVTRRFKNDYLTSAFRDTLTIGTLALPDALAGIPYQYSLDITGGVPPYASVVTSGSLPAGITLLGTEGLVAGTAAATGSNAFIVQTTDAEGTEAARSFTLAVLPPLVISTSELPDGHVGVPYLASLGATGGRSPHHWSLAAGTLPAGLSLDSATGVISGSPTVSGDFPLTLRVSEANGYTALRSLTLSVCCPPARISGSSPAYFPNLQEAADAAADGDTIESLAHEFVENVSLSGSATVQWRGGFGRDYAGTEGYSTIRGTLTVSGGAVVIDRIVLR